MTRVECTEHGHSIRGKIKHTLMLILASAVVLIIEFRSHLIQQFCQATVWCGHHPTVRIVHLDELLSIVAQLARSVTWEYASDPCFYQRVHDHSLNSGSDHCQRDTVSSL